ncbi:MAG: glycosyltransferase [Anaerolineae bacterium]|nr:glycosyltransferase [Anaerolineae bacterium]
MIETSLRLDAQRRLADAGTTDVVVGIPTYKHARTLARVIKTVAEGLARDLRGLGTMLAIVDGGSPDDTLAVANQTPIPSNVKRLVTSYQGVQGKGSAVRGIFEIARAVRARVIVILEADLQSISPDWVERLARPILENQYQLAIPHYLRPLPDGAMTDLLAYPITRLLYGADVRQPMGGEYALSAELAHRFAARDVWETDVARHGVDIWLTTVAINENVKVCQVRLGVKLDDSRELQLSFDPTFVQAIGTLFRMMDIYKRRWHQAQQSRNVPYFGNGAVRQPATPWIPSVSTAALSDAFVAGSRRYARLWRTALTPSTRNAIRELSEAPDGATRFGAKLWARTVYDFATVYNQGEGDPDKVVAALLPLYFARCATIMRETALEPNAVELTVQEQAKHFAIEKPYLVQLWDTYVPWAWEGVR